MVKDGTKAVIGLGVVGGITAAVIFATKAKAAPPPPPPGLANLYGNVYDATTGKGIANALITLGEYSGYTQSDGYYAWTNITPGAYSLSAQKEGYNMASQSITLNEGQNTLNVALTPIAPVKANLSGQVTDAQTGYPIQGVKVTLNGKVKTTDADGIYAFFDLTPGSYTIKFEKSGYQTLTM